MTKPRLLLIAGWAQTTDVFAPLAERLSEFATVEMTSVYQLATDYQAAEGKLTGDFPPQAVSLYAQQLGQQLSTDEPTTLLGWSMGGMVALEAAAAFAPAVDRLIVVAGCASFCSRQDYPLGTPESGVEEMAAGLETAPERTFELFLRNVYRRTVDKQELARKTEQAMTLDIARLQHGLAYLQHADLRGQLAQVAQPTLLLHGEADRVVPAAAAGYLQEHLPQTTLKVYPAGTHGLCEQFPAEATEQIRGFLADGE